VSENKTVACTNEGCWLRSPLLLSSVGLAQLRAPNDPFPVWAVIFLLGNATVPPTPQMILAMTEFWVAEVPK